MIGGTGSLIGTKRHEPPLPPNSFRSLLPNTTFSISPTVGYFIINNLMTGVTTSFSYGWNTTNSVPRNTMISIGPLLRYYFPFRKFAVFPEVAAVGTWQYNRSNAQDPNGLPLIYTDKYKRSNYRAGAGVAWFVAPNIGIEGVAAYRQVNSTSLSTVWQSQLYVTLAIQFYLSRN